MTQAWRNFTVGSSVWEPVGEGKDFTPESFKLPTPEPEPEKNLMKRSNRNLKVFFFSKENEFCILYNYK